MGFDTLCGMNMFKRRALAQWMLKLGAALLALASCVLWAASPVPANLRVEWRVVSSSQARSQAESQAARTDAGGVSVSSADMAQRQDSIHSVQVLNGSQARVYVGRTVPQTTWQFLYSGAATSSGNANSSAAGNASAQLLSQTNWIDLGQGLTVRPRWRGGSAPVEVEVEAKSRNHVGVMSGSSIAPDGQTQRLEVMTTMRIPLGQWAVVAQSRGNQAQSTRGTWSTSDVDDTGGEQLELRVTQP